MLVKRIYIIQNQNMDPNDKKYKLLINGEEIVLVSKTSFLGSIVDVDLEWKEQIDLW